MKTFDKPTLTLATRNSHKVEEMAALLEKKWAVRGVATVAPDLRWEETGNTFRANALIKAKAVQDAVGGHVLADDSGLVVDALGGEPGVYSSRYAGKEGDDAANNDKLLASLLGVPESLRTARFVCCLCLLTESGDVRYFEGACEGRIMTGAKGQSGFGYDPLFWVTDLHKGMAEMSLSEKNTISHRARAMAAFQEFSADL